MELFLLYRSPLPVSCISGRLVLYLRRRLLSSTVDVYCYHSCSSCPLQECFAWGCLSYDELDLCTRGIVSDCFITFTNNFQSPLGALLRLLILWGPTGTTGTAYRYSRAAATLKYARAAGTYRSLLRFVWVSFGLLLDRTVDHGPLLIASCIDALLRHRLLWNNVVDTYKLYIYKGFVIIVFVLTVPIKVDYSIEVTGGQYSTKS